MKNPADRIGMSAVLVLTLAACGASPPPPTVAPSAIVPTLPATSEATPSPSPSPIATATPEPADALSYVALGDSLLYALESDCDSCISAAAIYGEQMATDLGEPVAIHNLTMHNGLTSSGLREYLENGAVVGRNSEDILEAVAAADAVSVTIGFNDFPSLVSEPTSRLDTFRTNLDAILGRIDDLRADETTMVRVTEIYNNGGPVWTALVEAQNEIICDVAAQHDAQCVDVYRAFNGEDGSADPIALGYLGPDQTHPSQLGMDVIAEAMTAAGYAPLE